MMASSKDTPVTRFARTSRTLRNKIEGLLKEATELTRVADGDRFAAGAAVASEAVEWSALVQKCGEEFALLSRTADQVRSAAAEGFIDLLRRALRAGGHEVYGESALLIVDGTVHVELDLTEARTKINGTPHEDMSHKGLVDAVESQVALLARLATPVELCLVHLLRAYEGVIARTGQKFGSQVTTMELLPLVALQRQSLKFLADPVSSAFASYPLSCFRADLLGVMRAERPQAFSRTN